MTPASPAPPPAAPPAGGPQEAATPLGDDLMYEVPGQVLQRMTADIGALAAENERLRAEWERYLIALRNVARILAAPGKLTPIETVELIDAEVSALDLGEEAANA